MFKSPQPEHVAFSGLITCGNCGGSVGGEIRLGPGHVGVIASVVTDSPQPPNAYKDRLSGLAASHVTVEVHACRHRPVPPLAA